jgi:sec-independent protein translocase protein TatA
MSLRRFLIFRRRLSGRVKPYQNRRPLYSAENPAYDEDVDGLGFIGSIGMTEIMLILVIAVLVWGGNLPDVARKAAGYYVKLRNSWTHVRDEVMSQVPDELTRLPDISTPPITEELPESESEPEPDPESEPAVEPKKKRKKAARKKPKKKKKKAKAKTRTRTQKPRRGGKGKRRPRR